VSLPERKQWQGLVVLSALGIEVSSAIAIGALIGYWLDGKFQTQPWLLILFTGFGIAAAVKAVWRELKKYQQGGSSKKPGEENNL